MDLSDLRLFRAIVEEGSVTRAAQRLNTVQSNVTTRLRLLEENLGTPLFDRINRRLVITPAGTLLDEDLLDDMEAARGLYATLGFEEVPPYYYNPIPGAHYLKVELG